jgi:hypothetical protein|tara:strand:- start:383 stop:517 length:135 start_codon:yes stop_codon:yes gene_type:complete
MPKKLHRKLSKAASKKGMSGERKKAYVYGTLAKVKKKAGGKNRT